MTQKMGVAEAKRRFSELIDRAARGERIVVFRRDKPAVTLVAPEAADRSSGGRPLGLAAFAGALADWSGLDAVTKQIYQARRKARDRRPPKLD